MGLGPQRLVLISMSQIITYKINSVDVQSKRIPQNQDAYEIDAEIS